MGGAEEFERLIQRLRGGDQEAANSLVRRFEPEVRRFVRFRLTSLAMRRLIDSVDVSQSVLAKFFVELEKGTIEVASPDQLRRLLITMARNKLYDHARTQNSVKRNPRRVDATPGAIERVTDPLSTPSEEFDAAELVEAVRARLSPDELYLLNQRLSGRSWGDLANERQSTSEAIRKRVTRAIDRVARELGVIK